MRRITYISLCLLWLFPSFAQEINGNDQYSIEAREVLRTGNLELVSDPRVWELLSGGDLIGNGGGVVENNFQYALMSLPSFLRECLSNSKCLISDSERNLVKDIMNVALFNRAVPYRLIFLSAKDHPNFFTDAGEFIVRTAKTGFEMGMPVFINRDHLYRDGEPAMSKEEIISLLIHELGHQTGVRSHSHLDELGGKIRFFLSKSHYEIEQYIGVGSATLGFFNFRSPNIRSEVYFSFEGLQVDVKPFISNALSCPGPDRYPVGYSLSNPHWKRSFVNENGERIIPFGSWIKVHCMQMNTVIWPESHDLEVLFKVKGPKLSVEVNLK